MVVMWLLIQTYETNKPIIQTNKLTLLVPGGGGGGFRHDGEFFVITFVWQNI